LVASSMLATTLRSNAAEAPLAIRGYDPVTYFTEGKAARGHPEFEYEWDERRYRFSSAAHRELSPRLSAFNRRFSNDQMHLWRNRDPADISISGQMRT
jgi:hypothetical protein